MSPSTVVMHHRLLHEALEKARKWKWISVNPAKDAEPPRPEEKEIRSLDEEGMRTLLEAAEGTRLYVPILLAMATGMRRGEILGLKWMDIGEGQITVRRAVEADGQFKAPKTKKGVRAIAIGSDVEDALRRHRAAQAEFRLQLGPSYQDLDLVVCHPDGSLWRPVAFSVAFSRLAKASGTSTVTSTACGTATRRSCWRGAQTRRSSAKGWGTAGLASRSRPTRTCTRGCRKKQRPRWTMRCLPLRLARKGTSSPIRGGKCLQSVCKLPLVRDHGAPKSLNEKAAGARGRRP